MQGRLQQALPDLDDPAAMGADLGLERAVSPRETLDRVWPYLPALGITRVARQTGLDRIGIHTWSAVRPNAKALSVSQGKGLSDTAAAASAVMEAVEVAVAESIPRASNPVEIATANDYRHSCHVYDPTRLLPPQATFDHRRPIRWLRGIDLHSGAVQMLPQDAVELDCEQSDLPGICKNSNGLASGNNYSEALFHALCELIERDGTSLWSLLDEEAKLETCFSPASLEDDVIDALCQSITAAGFRLTLFDQTSNLGIPVVMAVLGPANSDDLGELEIASGYGCHPMAIVAAIRAITEAGQSRVTAIAGVRDDIDQFAFARRAPRTHTAMLRAEPFRGPPLDVGADATHLATVKAVLATNGCRASVAALADKDLPVAVVKVLSPDLEDRGANINWRPGWRAFDFVEQNLR
jgi:ribosomal protein S12 methylthiotransferase accessory factor